MRAIVYTEPGDTSVLRLVQRDRPILEHDEVLVRVLVSGVNPTDWRSRVSRRPGDSEEQVPGQDGAGVVEAVGRRVADFRPGDRVWLWDAAWNRVNGTAQEWVALPARNVVPLPDAASYGLGASLGIPALTAHIALTEGRGFPSRLSPGALRGRVVLVAGGAGAVGHAAIQLAVWAGAMVITTVSSVAKAESARRAGAHRVVNYVTDDVVASVRSAVPSGVDLVVEVAPVVNLLIDQAVTAVGGTIAVYASGEAADLTVPIGASMSSNLRMHFILTYTTPSDRKEDAVAAVSAALADGALGIGAEVGLPVLWVPLEDLPVAHAAVEAKFVGKVLVDVTGENEREGERR